MTDTTIDLGNQLITIKEAADLDRIAFHEGDVEQPTFLFGHSIELYCENGWTGATQKGMLSITEDYVRLMAGKITHYQPHGSARLKKIAGAKLAAAFCRVYRRQFRR
ncbi:MAG: hypothetical protein ACRYG8_01455 [Janthinobacterium lividum]